MTTLTAAIATYNVAPYISDCLDSILGQSFTDFKLICIDDGSTDDTVKIIKQYAEKDNRIQLIINPQNQGLAVIRNQSLELAQSKYILFLDGDDIYETTYFEKAIQLAEKEDSDFVICDYLFFQDISEIEQKRTIASDLNKVDANDRLGLLARPAFVWVKLINVETARELKIDFPKGYTRQDIPVHWHLITSAKKISILPEKLVFYRQQPQATTAQKNEKLFHIAFVMDVTKDVLHNNGSWGTYKKEFYRQQLNLLHGMYDNIHPSLQEKALVLVKERLTPEHYELINEGLDIRKQAKWFYLALKGDIMAKARLNIWKLTRIAYRKFK